MQARFNWETMAQTQTKTETASPAVRERTPLRLPGVVGAGQTGQKVAGDGVLLHSAYASETFQ